MFKLSSEFIFFVYKWYPKSNLTTLVDMIPYVLNPQLFPKSNDDLKYILNQLNTVSIYSLESYLRKAIYKTAVFKVHLQKPTREQNRVETDNVGS